MIDDITHDVTSHDHKPRSETRHKNKLSGAEYSTCGPGTWFQVQVTSHGAIVNCGSISMMKC